jgi:hypothetical protein
MKNKNEKKRNRNAVVVKINEILAKKWGKTTRKFRCEKKK